MFCNVKLIHYYKMHQGCNQFIHHRFISSENRSESQLIERTERSSLHRIFRKKKHERVKVKYIFVPFVFFSFLDNSKVRKLGKKNLPRGRKGCRPVWWVRLKRSNYNIQQLMDSMSDKVGMRDNSFWWWWS